MDENRVRKPVDYYLSPGGDDANSGLSADKPVKTIHPIAAKLKPSDVVWLTAGEYPVSDLRISEVPPETP